jgi:hypothetical protein
MFVALDIRSLTQLWGVRQNRIPVFVQLALATDRLPAEIFRGMLLLRHLISDARTRASRSRRLGLARAIEKLNGKPNEPRRKPQYRRARIIAAIWTQ